VWYAVVEAEMPQRKEGGVIEMNENARRKSKSLKGKDKTEQEALWLPNGRGEGQIKSPERR
jgi:hypothetical protein